MNSSHIQIKPITNQAEFEEAVRVIDELVDADMIADTVERKKALAVLEAISIPASEYEKKHFMMPGSNPLTPSKKEWRIASSGLSCLI